MEFPNETYSDKRVNEILEVIMAYARLEFNNKIEVTEKGDVFDALSAGVNMLGEELKSSTISLNEKEHLLKEIHHRVKNNLQIIASLLNLQAQNVKDKKFLTLIRESKNRISSMALVHEMLYSTRDISKISASEYIQKLCANIYQSFYSTEKNVVFNYEIDEDLFFEIQKMIPIGLILNEIISNSLKYAFPKKDGIILIKIAKVDDKHFFLIKDDGIGIKKQIDLENSSTLGMQLINVLAGQLDATLKLECKKGTQYHLIF